ncbi:MAG: 7-cyano-7-deazaguanine synthase QueC [Halothiobacillaceae bacterium]
MTPEKNHGRPAVVLVSGGLDSATVLALAKAAGFTIHALSFDYGQRHRVELSAASRLARDGGAVQHKIVRIDLDGMGGSALTDPAIDVPTSATEGIPATYVPARNTVFLAFALGWAEILGARDIFLGVNAVDYSGYPDCRPEFIEQFQRLANLATAVGVGGETITIHAPLIAMSKVQIIRSGLAHGVDYAQTISCYAPDKDGQACGQCDACRLRRQGFADAGIPDPTRYA